MTTNRRSRRPAAACAAADYVRIPAAAESFPRVDQRRLLALTQDVRAGALTLSDAMLAANIITAYRRLVMASPGLRRAIVRGLGGEVTP